MTTPKSERNPIPAHPRSVYSAPRLYHYGSVTDLTLQNQSKPFFGNDGNTKCTGNATSAQKPCQS